MSTSDWHIAQVNIALLRAPLDSPELEGFVSMLQSINALADASLGFVWRLQSETGDATGIRAFDDDRIIVNLSVWEAIEALGRFVFASRHIEVLRRRREWFEKMTEAHLALWWIPAGTIPTVAEAEINPAIVERFYQTRGRTSGRDAARTRPVVGCLHVAGAVPRTRLERSRALTGSVAVSDHHAACVSVPCPPPHLRVAFAPPG